VLAFCLAEMTYFEMRGGVAQNIAGLALVVLALGPWLSGMGPIVARLATYAFGVYLCHMLFTELVKAFRIYMGWERTFPLDVARWAIAVGGSFIVVHLLRSNRYTRWLIPNH
jgi:surface polysaccharide O-acyltransferase-like enzyme